LSGAARGEAEFTLSFSNIDRTALPITGGKAANLGELVRAGFPVPAGFCVTTEAYARVAGNAGLEPVLDGLAETRAEDTARLAELAAVARAALLDASVPDAIVRAIAAAYEDLGEGSAPVAVRSSATAEDLPHASFAGQQDTYLNVVGRDALVEAVRRCWASLWTDRAVSYRSSNGIDHRGVHLAVAVQRMIEASVAGVLFTANPLTGRLRQAVIDASPGLGEAVVSGAVNPDHFLVDTATGAFVERRLGDKRMAVRATAGGGTQRVELDSGANEASLSDEQVRALAALGSRVEAHYGAPQDIEWAIDGEDGLWLLQARPITTLFPLPAGAPATDEDLHVYFSGSVAQGVYRPLTPMGLQAFRLVGSGMAALAGHPPRNPYDGPSPVHDAAGRLFIDVTPGLRSRLGRPLMDLATRHMEARTAPILRSLALDPRLAGPPAPLRPLLGAVLTVLVRGRVPPHVLQAFVRPEAARARAVRAEAEFRAARDAAPRNAEERLAAVERLLPGIPLRILRGVVPAFATGMLSSFIAGRLLGNLATDDERRVTLRALPYNPTTEMDLTLWALAQEVRADPEAARTVRETPPQELARDYDVGDLPPALQTGLTSFLSAYGHRGVAEIDLGLPRWSEDPAYILGVLANYLRLEDPERAPDVQFERAAREARGMVAELTRRAARRGRLRGALVGFFLDRARALAGLREMPKFCIILAFARARALLAPVGEELVKAGRLESAEDIYFVTLPEAHAGLQGRDLHPLVRERRSVYAREVQRRHVPRVLLSDGTEPDARVGDAFEATNGVLRGTAASGGVVKGIARVILDPNGADLRPGEILVAPSTDPGWTPLFLTAGGLVMEMGGAMSHGSVVAREYGIPAVVGVPDATERIVTGQGITVDGSRGTVAIQTPDDD
jgi:pyruvate,water dikinase